MLVLFCASFAYDGAQEALNDAWRLWGRGDCRRALEKMNFVLSRIDDFPKEVQPQIQATFVTWSDTVRKQQCFCDALLSAVPELCAPGGGRLPLAALKAARDSIQKLVERAQSIACRDIRRETMRLLRSATDSVNSMLDHYIDDILSENLRLRAAVDSLRKLARKNKRLSGLVDSLRQLVAQNSDRISYLEAVLDSVVVVASQAVALAGKAVESEQVLTSPTATVAQMALEMAETKVVAIGEGIVRPRLYTKAQEDSLLRRLEDISTWLDTSAAAKLLPQRALAVKELAQSYTKLLLKRQRLYPVKWVVVGVFALVMILVLWQVARRKGVM